MTVSMLSFCTWTVHSRCMQLSKLAFTSMPTGRHQPVMLGVMQLLDQSCLESMIVVNDLCTQNAVMMQRVCHDSGCKKGYANERS